MAAGASCNGTTAYVSSSGLSYLLHVPAASADGGRHPLVLFLHGAGESGHHQGASAWGLLPGFSPHACAWHPDRPAPVRTTPPGLAVDASPLAAGFYVLAPRTHRRWAPDSHGETLALLDEVLTAHPRIDPGRVVLTGISMGGAGAFSLGAVAPQRFAGVSPICGYGDAAAVMALRRTPLLVIHGTNDAVIPESASAALVAALREAGNAEVTYERVTGVAPAGYPQMLGHDSWSAAYGGPEWWAWARGLGSS